MLFEVCDLFVCEVILAVKVILKIVNLRLNPVVNRIRVLQHVTHFGDHPVYGLLGICVFCKRQHKLQFIRQLLTRFRIKRNRAVLSDDAGEDILDRVRGDFNIRRVFQHLADRLGMGRELPCISIRYRVGLIEGDVVVIKEVFIAGIVADVLLFRIKALGQRDHVAVAIIGDRSCGLDLLGLSDNVRQSAADRLSVYKIAAFVKNDPVIIEAVFFDDLRQVIAVRPVGQAALLQFAHAVFLAILFKHSAVFCFTGIQQPVGADVYVVKAFARTALCVPFGIGFVCCKILPSLEYGKASAGLCAVIQVHIIPRCLCRLVNHLLRGIHVAALYCGEVVGIYARLF